MLSTTDCSRIARTVTPVARKMLTKAAGETMYLTKCFPSIMHIDWLMAPNTGRKVGGNICTSTDLASTLPPQPGIFAMEASHSLAG